MSHLIVKYPKKHLSCSSDKADYGKGHCYQKCIGIGMNLTLESGWGASPETLFSNP